MVVFLLGSGADDRGGGAGCEGPASRHPVIDDEPGDRLSTADQRSFCGSPSAMA
jgi:hypothetical protein